MRPIPPSRCFFRRRPFRLCAAGSRRTSPVRRPVRERRPGGQHGVRPSSPRRGTDAQPRWARARRRALRGLRARHGDPPAAHPRRPCGRPGVPRRRRPSSCCRPSRSPPRSPPSRRGDPDSGGVATYVRLALGPTAARMTGCWFFFGVVRRGARSLACSGRSTSSAMLGGAQSHVCRSARPPRAAARHQRVAWARRPRPARAHRRRSSSRRRRGAGVPARAPDRRTSSPFAAARWAGVGAAAACTSGRSPAGRPSAPRGRIRARDAPSRAPPRSRSSSVGVAYLALQYVTVTVLAPSAASSTSR